jgi:predicted alpha/beta superfamily hydrolase
VGALGQSPARKENPKPFVLGTVDEIRSAQLGETRTLNIYLPEGYKADNAAKYPVIYLLDGGANEDFIHVVGLVQFSSFSWVNRLPPSIVVGITNVDRRRDLTYPSKVVSEKTKYPESGHSDKFIAFLERELQPYIENNYNASSTSRTLIGESLGGLFAAEVLLKKPELFDKYIIIAPSLWWDDGSLLRYPVDRLASGNKKTDVYVGVGKEGPGLGEKPHVGEVDARLLAHKLRAVKRKDLRVNFEYLPQENHATIAHQALLNAFRLMQRTAAAAK